MFYLITFYKVLLQTPVKSLLFVGVGASIVIGVSHKENLDNFFSNKSESLRQGNYFYALISGKKNHASISRKIRELPGVESVDILPEKLVRKSASEIFEQSNLDIALLLEDFKYAALKVVFSETLQRRSQELIREYLGRLTGKRDVALGSIKKIEKNIEQKKGGSYLMRTWGVVVALSLMTVAWILLAQSYVKEVGKKAYLIESFQRRKGVTFKIACIGVLSIFLIGVLLAFGIASPGFKWVLLSTVPYLVVILFFAKGGEWES